MKKILFLLTALVILVACDIKPTIAESGKIDCTEGYQIQQSNELGAPVDSYICILFERKAGNTFDEALNSIRDNLDMWAQFVIDDKKSTGMYDTEKWEIRQVICNVKNAPDDKLVYTSIELYMFSKLYGAYIVLDKYRVIDSEGNIYNYVIPND